MRMTKNQDDSYHMKVQREQEREDLQEQKEEREAEYAEMEYAASEPW